MRPQTTVPQWALDHVRDRMRPEEEVINAVAVRTGLFTASVLLNTSKGAALVAKSLMGGPRSVILTYPRDLMTFACTACARRNVMVGAAAGDDVHCTHCGAVHRLDAAGNVHVGSDPATNGSPAAGNDPHSPAAAKAAAAAGTGPVVNQHARRPRARTAARKPAKTSTGTRKNGAKRPARKKAAPPTRTKRATGARSAKKRSTRTATKKRTRSRKRPAQSRKTTPTGSAKPADRAKADKYKPQCGALTPKGRQCRNSARGSSKYCASHKGYRPPSRHALMAARDTTPRVRGARDTKPAIRRR